MVNGRVLSQEEIQKYFEKDPELCPGKDTLVTSTIYGLYFWRSLGNPLKFCCSDTYPTHIKKFNE